MEIQMNKIIEMLDDIRMRENRQTQSLLQKHQVVKLFRGQLGKIYQNLKIWPRNSILRNLSHRLYVGINVTQYIIVLHSKKLRAI